MNPSKPNRDESCHFPGPIKASQFPSHGSMLVGSIPSVVRFFPTSTQQRTGLYGATTSKRIVVVRRTTIADATSYCHCTPNQPQNVNYRTAGIGKYVLQSYLHTKPSCCHSHAFHLPHAEWYYKVCSRYKLGARKRLHSSVEYLQFLNKNDPKRFSVNFG